jgi:hypothetical protein
MGGPGSGGWFRCDKKGAVEDHQRLDVRELHRERGIKPGDWMTVQYEWCGAPGSQEVHFDWTPCHFGGKRPWLICMDCGRRVGVIYLRVKKFACRHCHDLTYRSCQESDSRFGKFLQNYDGAGGAEDLPLFFLKGYVSMRMKRVETLKKELARRPRGRPQKIADSSQENLH